MKKIIIFFLFCLLFANSYGLIIIGTGKSMLPTFPEYCLIKVKTVPFEKLDYWMIVVYKDKANNNNLTAHRLIHKTKNGNWVAKGDNNKDADPCLVTKENYEGVAELLIVK